MAALILALFVWVVRSQSDPCILPDPAQCVRTTLCNGEMCKDVCKIGTVQGDPWTSYGLETQWQLQYDAPFITAVLPGTHNSVISNPYNIGIEGDFLGNFFRADYAPDQCLVVIADNLYSATDQMNMGIRMLEIDIHWVFDSLRLCHWPVPPPNFLAVIKEEEVKQNVTLDWDPFRLGCWNGSLPADAIFDELLGYIETISAPNQFYQLYLDSRIPENHMPDYLEFLQSMFFNITFTPRILANRFNGSWPTIHTMIDNGYRVLFTYYDEFKQNSSIGNEFWFQPRYWNEFGATDFVPYPTCTVQGNAWYGKQFTRPLDQSLISGPVNDATDNGTLIITNDLIHDMTACGINYISLCEDFWDKMAHFVWTWDNDQPASTSTATNDNCAYLNKQGSWSTSDCTVSRSFACQSVSNPQLWQISKSQGPWQTTSPCPSEFKFAAPTDGYLNTLLSVAAPNQELWLAYRATSPPSLPADFSK